MLEETIEVYKPNNVNFVLSCSPGTHKELYHYFSKYVKNYQFDRRFKNRIWNGMINFYSTSEHTLPIGLITELIEFSKKYSYKLDYKFDPTTLYDKNFKKEDFDKYISENLTLPFPPRDYQIESVKKALLRKRGICLMPTSCLDGKSIIKARLTEEDLKFLKENYKDVEQEIDNHDTQKKGRKPKKG